jgi:hypothetical protein
MLRAQVTPKSVGLQTLVPDGAHDLADTLGKHQSSELGASDTPSLREYPSAGSARWVAAPLSAGLAAVFGLAPVHAQSVSPLENLRSLALDSLDAGVWVHYSSGHDVRAERMGRRMAASNDYFDRRLGVRVELRVALVDAADFARALPTAVYGMPFVRGGVAVLPADLESGAVVDAYQALGATATMDVIEELRSLGLSFEDAARAMVDLVALHELGHVQTESHGIDPRQAWFAEFMGTYFAYAYLRSEEAELARVWDAVAEAGRQGVDPTYTSLDDLNRLYTGVGPVNYVWFQDILQGRASSVYDSQALAFLSDVRSRFGNVEWTPGQAREMLDVLEAIEPGFITWSEGLSNR